MQYVEKYIYIFFFDKQLIPAAVLPLRFPRRIHDKIEFFFLCPKRIPDALYVIENIPIFNIALPAAVRFLFIISVENTSLLQIFGFFSPIQRILKSIQFIFYFRPHSKQNYPCKTYRTNRLFRFPHLKTSLLHAPCQRNAPLCYSHYNTSSRTLQGFRKNSPVAARPSAPPALPAMKAQIACLFARGML